VDWRSEYPRLKRDAEGVLHGVAYANAIPVVLHLGDGYVARGLVSEVEGRLALTSVEIRYESKGDPVRGLKTDDLRRVHPRDAVNAAAAAEYQSNIGLTIGGEKTSHFDMPTRTSMQRGAEKHAAVALLHIEVWNEMGGRRGVYREMAMRWKKRYRQDLSADQMRTLVFEARHTHKFLEPSTPPPRGTPLLREYLKTLPESKKRGKK
jgi:hypothetical protein